MMWIKTDRGSQCSQSHVQRSEEPTAVHHAHFNFGRHSLNWDQAMPFQEETIRLEDNSFPSLYDHCFSSGEGNANGSRYKCFIYYTATENGTSILLNTVAKL